MGSRNEQENFWEDTYSKGYIDRNSSFNNDVLIQGWQRILQKVEEPKNILECGSNIGRNLRALNSIYPDSDKTAIEISPDACEILKANFTELQVFNGSIIESDFKPRSFQLVFTMCVLIHIHPDELHANMQKIVSYSDRYILFGEYFNRTPTTIDYQGQKNKLFKRDFGRFAMENFSSQLRLVDHGFLWGHLYDDGGFDDITWFLFERT